MVDPIADMLTRIRNAQTARRDTVDVPFSRMNFGIAKILEEKGFVQGADLQGRKSRKMIEIRLRYEESSPAIHGLKRISKPGQRIYLSSADLSKSKRHGGVLILSTSKGLLADMEARTQRMGGEVLCEIW